MNATAQPAPAASLRTIAEVRAASAEGLPRDLPHSTYELLRRTAEAAPDAPAISFFLDVASHKTPERWTYRQLFERITRFANVLTRSGIGPGDVTAVLLPNLPEMHLALWGGEAAGIVMPINPMLEAEAIASLLRAAGAKALVTLAPFPGVEIYQKAAAAVALAPSVREVVLADLSRHVQGWRGMAARFLARQARRTAPRMRAGVRVQMLKALMRQAPGDRLVSDRTIWPGDIASYFGTGGTTGLPKLAARTHGNEVANTWMTTRMVGPALGAEATVYCGLPLFHVNAVMSTGLAPFSKGAHVVIGTPQGFRAPHHLDRFWEIVAHHRITAFSGVPTLFSALLEHPTQGHDLSAFRYAFCGAAPMSVELIRRFEAQAGVNVIEGYGLTEATCICSLNPVDAERRVGSVGLPLPLQSVSIVQLDEAGGFLREAAVDEVGAVTLAGPNVFQGYVTAEHNAKVWVERGDGRRWVNTGDLGRLDADGYLWLTGRAKDLIIRGGHNIDPAVIEDALLSHADVALAAAIGRPDAYAGEVPVAYVQLRPGHHVAEDALLAHVKARITERAAIPKAIRVREALPLTMVGKIFKPALRLDELADVAREALAEAGVRPLQVEARADPKLGGVVTIAVKACDEPRVHDALQGFTFHVEVQPVAPA